MVSSGTEGQDENEAWISIANITGILEINDIVVDSANDSLLILEHGSLLEVRLEDAAVLNKIHFGFNSFGVMDWNDEFGWLAIEIGEPIDEKYGYSPFAILNLNGEIVDLASPWGSLPSYTSSEIMDMAWRPNSSHLAIIYEDGTLRVYDIALGTLLSERKFGPDAVRIEWSHSGGLLAMQTRQRFSDQVEIYDMVQNSSWTMVSSGSNILDLGWSRDDGCLFMLYSGYLFRCPMTTMKIEVLLQTGASGISPSPEEDVLVLISERNGITFWDYASNVSELHGSDQYLSTEGDWTDDGSFFYTMEEETHVVRIWGKASGIPRPTVHIDNPLPGSVVTGLIDVSGRVSSYYANLTTVSIKVGSLDWAPARGGTEWHYELDTRSLPEGWTNIRARASDPAGTSDIAIVRVMVRNEVQPNNTPPRIWIDEPADRSIVMGLAMFKGGAADDRAVVSVQLRIGTDYWSIAWMDESGPTTEWSYIWDFTGATSDREVVIQARAYDGQLFSDVVSRTLTVRRVHYDFTNISVEILYPVNWATVEPDFSISGIVNGGNPEVVYVRMDYDLIRVAQGTRSWHLGYVGTAFGAHTAAAIAMGSSGVSWWITVNFKVQETTENLSPAVGINAPVWGSVVDGDLRVRGWSADDVEVKAVSLRINGGEWFDVAGTTEWTHLIEKRRLDEGWNSIDVRAFDGELYSPMNSTRFYFVPGGFQVKGISTLFLGLTICMVVVTAISVAYALHQRGSMERGSPGVKGKD